MSILVPPKLHYPVSLLGTMPNKNIRRLLVSPHHVYCHQVISLSATIRSSLFVSFSSSLLISDFLRPVQRIKNMSFPRSILRGLLGVISVSYAAPTESFAPLIERQASSIPDYVKAYGIQLAYSSC